MDKRVSKIIGILFILMASIGVMIQAKENFLFVIAIILGIAFIALILFFIKKRSDKDIEELELIYHKNEIEKNNKKNEVKKKMKKHNLKVIQGGKK